MTQPPLWLAIHEAGHVVAHLAINEQLSEPETILIKVSLIGDEKNAGFVRQRPRRIALPHHNAVRCLSGYAAESLHTKGADWLRTERQTIIADVARGVYDNLTDIRMAREALGADAACEIEVGRAWDAACDLVAREWDSLIYVAGILQYAGTMDGATVTAEWRRHKGTERRCALPEAFSAPSLSESLEKPLAAILEAPK